MKDLEDRLRTDLPALADALAVDRTLRDGEVTSPVEASRERTATHRRRRATWMVGAATCAAVLLVTGVLVSRDDAPRTVVDAVDGPVDPRRAGTWEPIPEAPIQSRAHPVSMWTGAEALFWAGSSLDRNFAYGDAAAYDPSSEAWRPAPEPGWGHPGLISVEVDGRLYATAKGSVGRLDVGTGEWIEIPPFDQLEVRSITAGDGGIWALGPRPGDPSRLGAAFYDAEAARWADGADLDGDAGAAALEALTDLTQPVLWTGHAVVVWGEGQGFVYDPAVGWSTLPPLTASDGEVVATHAVADRGTVLVLAELVVDGRRIVRPHRWDPPGPWSRIPDVELVVEDLDRTTVAMAGDRLMLLPPEGPPVSLDPSTGESYVHTDAPIRGIEGPGTVWTGTRLIVWGGVHADASDLPADAGMIWNAPDHG